MSEAESTSYLQRRLDELTRENESLRREAKDRRIKGKTLAADLDEARKQLGEATAERDRLKATPDELQARVAELQGELRTGKHRSRFDELAKELKVRPEALADLWSLSGYKAEADLISDDAIKTAIAGTLKNRPHFVVEDGAGGSGSSMFPGGNKLPPTDLPAMAGGPTAARSDFATKTGATMVVTKAQLQSPAWSLDPVNQKAMAEASKINALTIKD
jgi:FtsZ-binding cell division protein ZapB